MIFYGYFKIIYYFLIVFEWDIICLTLFSKKIIELHYFK